VGAGAGAVGTESLGRSVILGAAPDSAGAGLGAGASGGLSDFKRGLIRSGGDSSLMPVHTSNFPCDTKPKRFARGHISRPSHSSEPP
jgi:hypothetical protein